MPSSVSPILASSLGLNRIKTRSGPLPQESFFSFNRADSNKASSMPVSNLSRGAAGGSSSGKKVAASKLGFLDGSGSGSRFDKVSVGSSGAGVSKEESPNVLGRSPLQTGEPSSSGSGIFGFYIIVLVNFCFKFGLDLFALMIIQWHLYFIRESRPLVLQI